MNAVRGFVTRVFRMVFLATALGTCMGAQYRSDNFIVSADNSKLARQIAEEAERLRHDLAMEWLDAAIPDWPQACAITVQVGSQLEPGGATTSVYNRDKVYVRRMTVQGSVERIFDSVLPHEITHAIFASHFRQQLPRWADEGGATNVEPALQKTKYREMLLKCLRDKRGIPLDRLFAMTEYPPDAMPLFTQGYALADFLIQRGGRRKYVDFLTAVLKSGRWSEEIQHHYGIADLDKLQSAWSLWISQGFSDQQPLNPTISIASSSP
jgi:hypothetical protein